ARPGHPRLGPAKQSRGYADQVHARRIEIVSCERDTSHPCKKIFPRQPCRPHARGGNGRGPEWTDDKQDVTHSEMPVFSNLTQLDGRVETRQRDRAARVARAAMAPG